MLFSTCSHTSRWVRFRFGGCLSLVVAHVRPTHRSLFRVLRTSLMPSQPGFVSASPLGSTSTAVCCASLTSNSSPPDIGRAVSSQLAAIMEARGDLQPPHLARERKLLQLRRHPFTHSRWTERTCEPSRTRSAARWPNTSPSSSWKPSPTSNVSIWTPPIRCSENADSPQRRTAGWRIIDWKEVEQRELLAEAKRLLETGQPRSLTRQMPTPKPETASQRRT